MVASFDADQRNVVGEFLAGLNSELPAMSNWHPYARHGLKVWCPPEAFRKLTDDEIRTPRFHVYRLPNQEADMKPKLFVLALLAGSSLFRRARYGVGIEIGAASTAPRGLRPAGCSEPQPRLDFRLLRTVGSQYRWRERPIGRRPVSHAGGLAPAPRTRYSRAIWKR